MRHHTKDKGDAGVGFVISALLREGIQPALLLSEHLPFDCIAVSPFGELCRLSVKYRSAKGGAVIVSMRSSWADKKGVHTKNPDYAAIDAVAVYCPDTGCVYYVRSDELSTPSFQIRIEKPKNGQVAGIRFAEDLLDPMRIFSGFTSSA